VVVVTHQPDLVDGCADSSVILSDVALILTGIGGLGE
jgi:hypothetical protein